jgi:hypothetical protein
MRAEIHPAARRITWLVIAIGALAVIIASIYFLFNLGAGIALPFTRTPLDVGWLLIVGLLWFAVGLIMLWWLRPVADQIERDNAQPITQPAAPMQPVDDTRLDSSIANLGQQIEQLGARLNDVDQQVTSVQERLKTSPTASSVQAKDGNPLRDLDNELGSLATAIQDAHTRLDGFGDVHDRLSELESQLDALYVTLQDAHRRLDSLEQVSSR